VVDPDDVLVEVEPLVDVDPELLVEVMPELDELLDVLHGPQTPLVLPTGKMQLPPGQQSASMVHAAPGTCTC
jgi:hypothetical protein